MNNKFVVDQKPLMAVLSFMHPICNKRTTLDATSSILFQVSLKELILKSTDLEISLQSSYLLKDCDIDQTRSFLVSGKRIFDIVKELDGQIEFYIEESQLIVKSGKINLSLNIKDSSEFPPFPERIENLMHIETEFLLDMFSKVSFLIPQNNSNPALNGLYWEIDKTMFKMTSTDGHCLVQVKSEKYNLEENKNWLLPRRAIFEVKKILESSQDKVVFIGTCGNQLVFSGESFNFFTKLLAEPFPQYSAILEKEGFYGAKVDRESFSKTLRRSACLLSGQFIATKFAFESESLHVSMQNKEVGKLEEEIPLLSFDGEKMDIRFYAPYLVNGLQVFGEDNIEFYLKNSSRPIVFESHQDEKSLTYLVMPVSAANNQ